MSLTNHDATVVDKTLFVLSDMFINTPAWMNEDQFTGADLGFPDWDQFIKPAPDHMLVRFPFLKEFNDMFDGVRGGVERDFALVSNRWRIVGGKYIRDQRMHPIVVENALVIHNLKITMKKLGIQ